MSLVERGSHSAVKFRLFSRFEDVAEGMADPAAQEYYALVERMREVVRRGEPAWANYHELVDYAAICFWAIRKLEYSFAARACAAAEASADHPLRILDVGSGVVPFCNWLSRRGHVVTATDPDRESIEFLQANDLNGFYGSNVHYEVAHAEDLRFDDESFDLVTCISVLEHIPPGNDRIALREIARVLKPGGVLVMTTDIAPPAPLAYGDRPWPAHLRRYAKPFSPVSAARLLRDISASYEVDETSLPEGLSELDQETLESFWRAAQLHDVRPESVREYLAIGGVLGRRANPSPIRSDEKIAAYLEGQEALQERLGYFELHARERYALVERVNEEGRLLRAQVDELTELVNELKEASSLGNRIRNVRARWNGLIGPRIGILQQYDARPLQIPEHYSNVTRLGSPPLISIVTPSLNQGPFIERTLRSVLDQSYPSLEYIVQDGGSTDESVQILARYRESLTNVTIEPDDGFGQAINRGFRRSRGEIMAYLNSDDLLLPGALHYVANYFDKHPDVDVVYGHRIVIDASDGEVGRWILPPHDDEVLKWADYVPQETLFWRRRIWDRTGAQIDENFRFAIDWDLLLRFRAAGAKMARLPRFIGAFRIHPHSKTTAVMRASGIPEMNLLRKRSLGRDVTSREISRALAPYLRRHGVLHRLFRLGVLHY
jgi:2-polyprenyl-3-methyl-5-hydroxy-6-metoxy-1,4-benzoquinol methylase